MELKKYDEKLVRIKTNYNEEFEGYCVYNDREYNECEFGINEEALFLQGYIIIKKSEIEEIIRKTNILELTPIKALNLLYELKEKLK